MKVTTRIVVIAATVCVFGLLTAVCSQYDCQYEYLGAIHAGDNVFRFVPPRMNHFASMRLRLPLGAEDEQSKSQFYQPCRGTVEVQYRDGTRRSMVLTGLQLNELGVPTGMKHDYREFYVTPISGSHTNSLVNDLRTYEQATEVTVALDVAHITTGTLWFSYEQAWGLLIVRRLCGLTGPKEQAKDVFPAALPQ